MNQTITPSAQSKHYKVQVRFAENGLAINPLYPLKVMERLGKQSVLKTLTADTEVVRESIKDKEEDFETTALKLFKQFALSHMRKEPESITYKDFATYVTHQILYVKEPSSTDLNLLYTCIFLLDKLTVNITERSWKDKSEAEIRRGFLAQNKTYEPTFDFLFLSTTDYINTVKNLDYPSPFISKDSTIKKLSSKSSRLSTKEDKLYRIFQDMVESTDTGDFVTEISLSFVCSTKDTIKTAKEITELFLLPLSVIDTFNYERSTTYEQ